MGFRKLSGCRSRPFSTNKTRSSLMSAHSGRANTRVHSQKVAKFFRELSRSGSVTLPSERSGIRR
jgi:hypothetical protein